MHSARECVCFQGPSSSCWNHCHVPNGAAQAEGTTCAKAPRRKESWLMGGPDCRPPTEQRDGSGDHQEECAGAEHDEALEVTLWSAAIILNRTRLAPFLVVWPRLCAPNAGGLGLIPGQGTRSHVLWLGVHMLQVKIHVPQLRPQPRPSAVK